ncbi:MAG: hypothetical protein DWQ06_13680 [Calditrichaeota bacterium]|nr:MAG: hypothetical protein DWQ06_13680 [Calditrichota bacterium]
MKMQVTIFNSLLKEINFTGKLISVIFVFLFQSFAFSDSGSSVIDSFFSPIPKPDSTDMKTKKCKWRPSAVLPAFKITESSRDNSKVDVSILTSVGGGISLQKLKYNDEIKKWESTFSWSPLTILLSGKVNEENTTIDLSLATTFGFFNDWIMIGAGYDLGSVSENRNRFFGLLSVGINRNN